MNRRLILIVGGVIAAVVLAVAAFFIIRAFVPAGNQFVSLEEPTDIVKDFYQPWLEAALSTTTDPYEEGFAKAPILSPEVQKYLKKARSGKDVLDPVLCQPTLPPEFSTRTVSATPEKYEVLVMARPSGPPEQAIVTLLPLNGGWYISEIRCSAGEVAPEREFSFENEGFLMKNVPAPLNAQNWHLIFTENEEMGHFAPLFFGPESMCYLADANGVVCDPSTFRELEEAHVQGEMTESGVKVLHVRPVKK